MTTSLPISDRFPELINQLQTQEITLLSAEPGAGKTTRVPLWLQSHSVFEKTRILMTAPRRVAAQANAQYMSSLLGEKPGQTIGYRVKGEHKISASTRLEILTTGVLLRMLQNDPELSTVDLVILDEFHERTMDCDLILALLRQTNLIYREENPIRILIMSATLAQEQLESALQVPVIFCSGRLFPITEHYLPRSARLSERANQVPELCLQALNDHDGDLLCFLPGLYEIEQTRSALENTCLNRGYSLRILHGRQKLQEQIQAMSASDQRRVILATSVAETSLTIDGVTLVVDSGLTREARFDKRTGQSQLHTRSVTQAEARQRAGRAGRTQAGHVFRCWSQEQHPTLADQPVPEISRLDLTPLSYQLIQWGSDDVDEFDWITPPENSRWQAAINQLSRLQLIEKDQHQYRLTEEGLAASRFPLSAPLAKVWLKLNQALPDYARFTGAWLVSLLQEQSQPNGLLLIDYALEVERQSSLPLHRRCLQGARQLLQAVEHNRSSGSSLSPLHEEIIRQSIQQAIISAFPLQVARRIKPLPQGKVLFKMANGRQAELHHPTDAEWVVVLQTQSRTDQERDRITLWLDITEQLLHQQLSHLIEKQTICQWQNNRLINETALILGKLELKRSAGNKISPQHCIQAGIQRLKSDGLDCLPWNEESLHLHQRLLFAHKQQPEQWPDTQTSALIETADEWLAPYLNDTDQQKKWQQLPLSQILMTLLPWDKQQALSQQVPEYFSAASGRRIRLDYSEHRPTMKVKLQEMFGTETVRKILGSDVNISLLSPAGRPLAVTSSLSTFWKEVYPEVRKEMRGRYPKHPWPEDPLTAEATHKTNRQIKK